jgi:succinate dehydrogenase hydrophobic anchor subunit
MNGSGQGSRELSTQSAARAPLPGALRVVIYAVGALLWISGAMWLVLHHAFPQASAFGALPNPWEAPLMRVHGLIAVCAVFLIGWMSAAHVTTRWSSDRNRRSGLALGVTALLLVFSGYALYYTIGSPHDTAGFLHEALGLLSPAAAVAHWWRNRSRT